MASLARMIASVGSGVVIAALIVGPGATVDVYGRTAAAARARRPIPGESSGEDGRPRVPSAVLAFSTYYGGCRGFQEIRDVAIDASGCSYVAGLYPWDCDRGPSDIFVSKFDPAGGLVFRTTLGGQYADEAAAIAVDAAGNIYLTGSTASNGCCRPFPVLNALQPVNGGGLDAFVIELDPTGQTVLFSTFLGGTGDDRGTGIAVGADGRIYVTGATNSIDFPTRNPWQAVTGGGTDAFLAVLEPGGSSLVFSSYLGGSGDEAAVRLALSEQGPVVAGTTTSPDFPTRGGDGTDPLQPVSGGGASDVFLAVMTPSGALQSATYLGGSGKDEAYGLALAQGHAFVTGSTDSPDFPTARPFQPSLSLPPESDAFLAKVPLTASGLAFSTYLEIGSAAGCASNLAKGGRPCGGLAVDAAGNAFVTAPGVFAIKVDPAGARRIYTDHGFGGQAVGLGGTASPESQSIFVAGATASFLFPTLYAVQPAHHWYESQAGWLTKLNDAADPGVAFEEDDPRIAYTGTWERYASAEQSGGAALRSSEAGAKATITFTGTGLQVTGRRDQASGVVRVSEDGDPEMQGQPLDTYASPEQPRALLVSISGLSQGTHTVTLEVAGTGNDRSGGAWVVIDGINVLNPL